MSRHSHRLIDMSMSPDSVGDRLSKATEEERVFLLVDYDSISSDLNLEVLHRLVAKGCSTHQLTTQHPHLYTGVGNPKAAACVRSIDAANGLIYPPGTALPLEVAKETELGNEFFNQGYWPYLYQADSTGYGYDTPELNTVLSIFMPRYTTGIIVSNNPELWDWINGWRVWKKKRMFCVIEPDEVEEKWQDQPIPMVNLTSMILQWTQMFSNCVPA